MMKIIFALTLCLFPVIGISANNDEYFYCGFVTESNSTLQYAKWGKGTTYKYNVSTNRWEWLSEYSDQFIYPDGRYEQIAKSPIFEDEAGVCNEEMEKAYNAEIEKLQSR